MRWLHRYWPLGDLFHFIVGVVFMLSSLYCYAHTTNRMSQVIDTADQRCVELHMPSTRRDTLASTIRAMIGDSTTHVAGVAITQEFCIMFVWAVVLTVWSSLCGVMVQW